MNIWKTLGIEPTTDKKAIRKAYAAKTKVIHPEEKPEEFKQLHEAYRAALGFAEHLKKVSQSGGSITSFYITPEDAAENTEEEAAQDAAENAEEEAAQDAAGNAEEEAAQDAAGTTEEEAVRDAAENTEEEAARDTAETTGEAELISYFGQQQERQQQRVDAFVKYWQEMGSPGQSPEALDWWKEYLASEEFQDIRYHSQVLHLLAEEIEDKCLYGINELAWKLCIPAREIDHKYLYGIHDIKLLFWDAYGFEEDEESVYQGDLQRLWKSLYPAVVMRKQAVQDGEKHAKKNKMIRIFAHAALAAVFAICLMAFFNTRIKREKERLFLIDYMARQYPEAAFLEPKYVGKDGFGGDHVYTMDSSAHPELSATATVFCRYVEGKKQYQVRENYGEQLLEYYAAQYGLASGWVSENSALVYEEIGEIDAFCAKVEKMFREQEELQRAPKAAIYTEQVLFPKILFLGGIPDLPFADAQIYDLGSMDAEELSEALREAYMCYMFQYESWNITGEQYREWGAAYEKLCERWENDEGEWHEVYDPDSGEYLCRLFISSYEKRGGSFHSDGTPAPTVTRMMTLGNAYYFLREQGADLTVDEDGRGFRVTFYGSRTRFGNDPEVKFDDLRHCY